MKNKERKAMLQHHNGATEAVKNRAIRHYNLHGSSVAAGEHVGYSHQAVLNWVRQAGLPVQACGNRLTKDLRRQIVGYVAKGNGIRQSAEKYQVTPRAVRNALKWGISLLEDVRSGNTVTYW